MTVRSFSRHAGVLVLVAAIGWLGCSTTSETDGAAGGTDTGSEFQEAPVPRDASSQQSRILDMQTVYFAYDSSEIKSDARAALQQNANVMGNGLEGTVTIEGHCDERGSAEYNLALGERRANAVRNYLVDLGVPSSRLRTVSFGEDRPAVQGHDESAWRYNRRADFVQ